MAKSEQELILALTITKVRADRAHKKLFYCDHVPDDTMLVRMVHHLRELNKRIKKVNSQLDKVANDSIADTVASLREQ